MNITYSVYVKVALMATLFKSFFLYFTCTSLFVQPVRGALPDFKRICFFLHTVYPDTSKAGMCITNVGLNRYGARIHNVRKPAI